MLFLALISTGAGCAFAIVTRFKGIIAKWFKCSETISGVIIALVILAKKSSRTLRWLSE